MTEQIVIRSARDVSRFVDAQPATKAAFWIVLIALGGVFVDAYDFTSLGIGVVQLRGQFHLSPFEVGSVTATMALGAVAGALCGGYYTDKIGRFKMFLLDLIFLVVAAIGAALSVNLTMLLFFRFLMGIGVGLDFPVALSFIAEFVGARKKGGSINLWQPMWFIAASCTGLVILPFYYLGAGANLWRIAVGFGAVPALLILILRYRFMDESPIWAAQNLGLERSARVLEKTYGVAVNVAPEQAPVAAHFEFREIFSPRYLSRTILVSIICATQSMEYFAVGFNIPTLSTRIFGSDFLFAILGAILFNLFGIVGGLSGSAATATVGPRRLAILGYALVIASLLGIYFGGADMPIAATALLIGLFIFGHSFGPGAQGMTMATLSFPARIRGCGTGWAQGVLRIGSILGFYFFPLMVAAVGLQKMMLYLTLVPLIGLIAAISIGWKTVDSEAEDAQRASSGHIDSPAREIAPS